VLFSCRGFVSMPATEYPCGATLLGILNGELVLVFIAIDVLSEW
jgi:hypothetical protein